MNLFVHGMEPTLFRGDALGDACRELNPANVIITNPPFGAKKGGGRPARSDLPFPTSNKQFAFLQHIYQGLELGGRAAVVLPDNVLFEAGIGKQIRADLMDKCDLHTILRLPLVIFYAQGVSTNVLFFTRGENGLNNTKEVWVYDLRTNMPQFGKRTPLRREHFADFEVCFGDDPLGGAECRAERRDTGVNGRFRPFTRDWIAERGENLDIGWLVDEREHNPTVYASPPALAREIIDELEGVMLGIRSLLVELGEEEEP